MNALLVYGLLGIAVATAVGGTVYTYNTAIADKVKAQNEAQQLREANSEFANENAQMRILKAQTDALLAARRAKEQSDAALEARVGALLTKLLSRPEVRRWADMPVPPAVVDELRRDSTDAPAAAKDRKVKPLPKPVSATARPVMAGFDDQLGVASACAGVPIACAFVQRGQRGYICLGEG